MGGSRPGALFLTLAALFSACSHPPEQRAARLAADGRRFYEKGDYARAILQYKNAIQALPTKPETHYQLGLALLADGDGNGAAAEFRKATELNPKYPEAQLMLAKMMLASRNRELIFEAEKRMAQLVALTPQNEEAWNALALANWQLGKQEEAERRFRDALEKFPGSLKASVALAWISVERKDFPTAEKLLKNASEQEPKAALPLVALAEFYVFRGNLQEAEQCLRQAVQYEPQNSLPMLELLALQIRTGRMDQARAVYRDLSAAHGDQYRSVYAALLFDAGQRDEAITEFEKQHKENPKDRGVRTWLVRAYLRMNRLADARAILDDALRQNRQDVDALLQRSILHLWAGSYMAAQDDLAQVLHFRSDSAQAHYVLAKVYAARGALLSERQELGQSLRLDPQFLTARIDLAQALIAAGAAQAALELMNQTPDLDKDTAPAIIERNWALIASHDVEGLRSAVGKALAMGQPPDALLQSAVLQLHDRNCAGARVSITKVLALNPGDLRALDLLARSYVLENRPDQAAEKLREQAAAYPRSVGAQYIWGEWALTHGDRRQARGAFENALTVYPRYTPATLALAGLDLAEKKPEMARQRLQASLSDDRQNTAARLMLADLEEAAGNHALALSHYKAVLATEPDNLLALNNTAYLLADAANKPDEALPYVQRAKELAPDNSAIEDTLGWVLYCKGLYASALPHFQKAVSDEGTDRRFYHLGMAFFKLGDRSRSQQALLKALQANAAMPQAEATRKLLAQLEHKNN